MAQSLSKLLVHIIFSTKKRQPFISSSITEELYSYMTGIVGTFNSQMYEIGGVEDHVHLLLTLPRTIALSKLVEDIKKGSSKWIKSQGIQYNHFSWQNGYGAFSIGQSGLGNLREYIQNQKEHHTTLSFQDEYRAFLKKYNLAYDEKYIWD